MTTPASDAVVCECATCFASSLEVSQVLRRLRSGILPVVYPAVDCVARVTVTCLL